MGRGETWRTGEARLEEAASRCRPIRCDRRPGPDGGERRRRDDWDHVDRGGRRRTARSKAVSDDRLVSEERVLHAGLPMIARHLLPASPSSLLDRQDRAITSARLRAASRHVGRTRRRNHDGRATRTGGLVKADRIVGGIRRHPSEGASPTPASGQSRRSDLARDPPLVRARPRPASGYSVVHVCATPASPAAPCRRKARHNRSTWRRLKPNRVAAARCVRLYCPRVLG